ncbi:MAG: alpha/beta fold hydrolase [Gammaproteobacteria bacterium]|nr:alpha/beta fold hydrolase [Gammaproteobacteria bacterium]MBT7369099.1 alpha/beta fold hydrolase [Gammaproteobacteria bacterium]
MSHIVFDGPAGKLEGYLDHGTSDKGAVLCHPHPLYGGSMDDMVLNALNAAFTATGFTTLRFNFRGVGTSEGSHEEGVGEVNDVLAAVDLLERTEGCQNPILAGYSFGGGMAIKAAAVTTCERLILVAPPVRLFTDLEVPSQSALIILGESDQIVDANETAAWFEGKNTKTEIIPGTDHFFFGAHQKITEIAEEFLSNGA